MRVEKNETFALQPYKVKSLAGAATHCAHEYVLLPEYVPDGAHIIRLDIFSAQHCGYNYKATVAEFANGGFILNAPMHGSLNLTLDLVIEQNFFSGLSFVPLLNFVVFQISH